MAAAGLNLGLSNWEAEDLPTTTASCLPLGTSKARAKWEQFFRLVKSFPSSNCSLLGDWSPTLVNDLSRAFSGHT